MTGRTAICLLSVLCGIRMCAAAELAIVKASYGAAENTVDVTETVRKKAVVVPGACIAVTVDNSLAGKDPAGGFRKALSITYTEDGVEKAAHAREQDACVILPGKVKPSKEFTVVGAWYGGGDHWNDVTEKVRMAHREKLELTVSNANFGPDPQPGKNKGLLVVYSRGKAFKTINLREKQSLELNLFSR